MFKIIFTLAIVLLLPFLVYSQAGIIEQVHDFGNVGIDFTLFHDFKYVNLSDSPIKILKAQTTCDCSSVKFDDSLMNPGDTAVFSLSFSTRDYYGPTNKSVTVTTDNKDIPEITFHYIANVGQWFSGLKPRPISLFFLPGKKVQKIIIPNVSFDNIELVDVYKYDTTFNFKVVSESAKIGKNIELEVSPDSSLPTGTYHSNLTALISTGQKEKSKLTIPIKIVRY